MKEEISQLVDSRGRRPASNDDAFKLYSFSSSIPLFRRKYDWNVPKWEPDQIRRLHIAVYNQLTKDLTGGPAGLDSRLKPAEISKISQLLDVSHARLLYGIYLDLGPTRMADVIVDLLRGDNFVSLVEAMRKDSGAFIRLFSTSADSYHEERTTSCVIEAQPENTTVDLASLWSRVADDVNDNGKSTKHKLATECCTIFLNSKPDGSLIETVTRKEITKFRQYTATLPPNDDYLQRGAEIAQELGLTLYQLLKADSRPDQLSSKRWEHHDDERLIQLVQRQVNINARGPKRSNSLCWRTVARQMGNKTNEQCRLRWRAIGNTTLCNEAFDDSQLYMLQILHAAYGDNWHKIAKLMPGKQAHQCRSKFLSCLSQPDRTDYIKYYYDLKNAITNRNAAVNVRKWWARVDCLGMKMLKIANITKNTVIMNVLGDFYRSEEIIRRINRLFGDESLKRTHTLNGVDVLIVAEYLRQYSSHMVCKILNSVVVSLLKKSKSGHANDFRNIFDLGHVDESQFANALKRLLDLSWP
ncbi:myb-like DNA-binding domain containing protein, putative [Babesia bigemina]|uniref:Myb-like DNA-binding domain containing protein, putative n=1 Tax=Babesia bigemina TaxID=5866 RepID=A0A061D5E8_BABBI|nr:myb-like DNA-binding domain containing protein, putative [Babesia bigemina]CDR94194.1 myb-like DNA-binding domain containing protein, putative [Babesia bigemina]|eukprot:XP_012766380.1 myb-like DNA-binding domain containing protein, putative [Babesia bigemina]